ncbi:MAG: HD family phosphohydrolase [Bacteroidales bacterium]
MKKIFDFIRVHYREFFRGALFIGAILLILFTLPRERKFKYEFQKGKAWMHEDLVAPFDFPIYKTDTELIAERNSILNNLKPFFRYDSSATEGALNQFKEDLAKILEDNNFKDQKEKNVIDNTSKKIKEHIRIVHLKGILQPKDYNELREQIFSGITLLVNNQAYERAFEEIYTVNSAIEYLEEKHSSILANVNNEASKKELERITFSNYINPNLSYDKETTQKVTEDMLKNLSQTKGLVYAGERIISKGEIVNPELYQILFSLKREFESRVTYSNDRNFLIGGQALIIVILFVVLFLFLLNFRPEILQHDSKLIFILLLITSVTVVSSLLLRREIVSIYIIPFAIIPIFIRTFYDSRLALFIHLVTVFLVGFFVPNSFEFVFIHFIAGVVAIISMSNLYRRGKLFLSVGYVFLSYVLVYMGIVTIQEGSPLAINPLNIAWFAGNALLLLASYQLIYLFEKIFGFLSETTLMELSDTNQNLLRKLAEVAPGTFQHSLQVANLSESAIQKIGGNALLVRAGALYHDIGKMNNPYYFVENQSPDFNPHKGLDFEESAEIIIKHVTDGVQIAKKHNLPQQLIDFIRTHHGTTKVQYFYRLFKDKFPEAKEEFATFNYPGPKPFSRETAVVMMADSVEAASRSLKSITYETIDNLVENIINYQQIEDQFNDSDITFKDITIIKSIFKKKLSNIYHARIEYPKTPEQE